MTVSPSSRPVICRFAPSPTGFLHIGGARTALFNWLFARHHGGQFLLRVEDTDRARSNQDAIYAILRGLDWLGLSWDGEVVFQHTRIETHQAAAHRLLAQGQAYKCFATPEELTEMRERARAEKRTPKYDGRWRNRDPNEAPAGAPYVIRLKAPPEGETVIQDAVQGTVTIANSELDDMVLLRSDGTPTYMLSVVVDDHDMGISHVIRGDDHLTNAFRQTQLFHALEWEPPVFAHIPLIHGQDGSKMSKRHGATGVEDYRDMGLLPEALRNYLARLGWSHGDDEIFSTEQAVEWFSLEAIGRGPSRFDQAKLETINAHYLRAVDPKVILPDCVARLGEKRDRALNSDEQARVEKALPFLTERVKTLVELSDLAYFLVADRPIPMDKKATKALTEDARERLADIYPRLQGIGEWTETNLKSVLDEALAEWQIGFGKLGQPLRAALCGQMAAPSITDVLAILGRNESLGRISDQLATKGQSKPID
ncbi:MAG: glutamate--tRNA ligase [Pseudomonadota bacterium]